MLCLGVFLISLQEQRQELRPERWREREPVLKLLREPV